MKNWKTFYEAQTPSCFKEIIQALPPLPSTHSPSDKILLRLWSKHFLIETDKNIRISVFKVLQECSCWASRNGAVQTPNRNMFAGKFLMSERFLPVLREHIIFNVKWVEVRKMNEVFWVKLMSTGTRGRMYKSCVPDIIFSKKKKRKKKEILNHLYFAPNFDFFSTTLGRFSQCFLSNFSMLANHGGQHFYSDPSP